MNTGCFTRAREWHLLTFVSAGLLVALATLIVADLVDSPVVASDLWTPILSGFNVLVTLRALWTLLTAVLAQRQQTSGGGSPGTWPFLVAMGVHKTLTAVFLLVLSCVLQNLTAQAEAWGYIRDGAMHLPDDVDTIPGMVRYTVMSSARKMVLSVLLFGLITGALAGEIQFRVDMALKAAMDARQKGDKVPS
jgi:hypothetical protein